MFPIYLFFVFMVIHSAVGAIMDPANLPSQQRNTLDLLKCGIRDQILGTVSHRMAVKIKCKDFQNILPIYTQEKTVEMEMEMRSSLPTSRPYPGWNRETPTFVEKLYWSLVEEVPETVAANVGVSPLSLGLGMAALSRAAGGATKREILQALGLTAAKLPDYYTAIITSLEKQKENQAKVVTKLYLDQSIILESSLKVKTQNFRTKPERANFKRQCKSEIMKINQIVAEEIGGPIKDAVSAGDTVNENTVLLLLGVLYFDGKWETPFQKTMGFNGKFKFSEENSVQATYMSQTANYLFYKEVKEGEYKMLELPYMSGGDKTSQFSLIIILPDKLNGLRKVQEAITKDHTWLKNFDLQLSDSKVLIKPTIPRFTIDTQMEFKTILNKIKVNNVFGESAKLEGVSSMPTKLSAVQQKVYIRVDEKEVNAGGSTAEAENAKSSDHSAKMFVADHPFAFALIKRDTKAVLLMGHVLRPEFDPNETFN